MIWNDGSYQYLSHAGAQYALTPGTSTWTSKSWGGLLSFRGNNVWHFGNDIYYSYDSTQYKKSGNNWRSVSWGISFKGEDVWDVDGNKYMNNTYELLMTYPSGEYNFISHN